MGGDDKYYERVGVDGGGGGSISSKVKPSLVKKESPMKKRDERYNSMKKEK